MSVHQWLQHFLTENNISALPLAKPLYNYKITKNDFEELEEELKELYGSFGPMDSSLTDEAQICVFIYGAVWWRSCYDGGVWCWDKVYSNITPERFFSSLNTRTSVIWNGYRLITPDKLRLQLAGVGKQFFSEIIQQGGIPIQALKNDQTCYSRIIRSTLRQLPPNPTKGDIDFRLSNFQNLTQLFQSPLLKDLLIEFVYDIYTIARDARGKVDFRNVDLPIYIDPDNADSLLDSLLNSYVKAAKVSTLKLARISRFLVPSGAPGSFELKTEIQVDIDSRASFDLGEINPRICSVTGLDFAPCTRGTVEVRSSVGSNKAILQYRSAEDVVQIKRLESEISYTDLPAGVSFYFQFTSQGQGTRRGQLLEGGDPLDSEAAWIFDEDKKFLTTGEIESRRDFVYVSPPPSASFESVEGDAVPIGHLVQENRSILKVCGTLRIISGEVESFIKTGVSDEVVFGVQLRGEELRRTGDVRVFLKTPEIVVTKNGIPLSRSSYKIELSAQCCDVTGVYGFCQAKITGSGFSRRLKYFVLPLGATKPVMKPRDIHRREPAQIAFPGWRLASVDIEGTEGCFENDTVYLNDTEESLRTINLVLRWQGPSYPLRMEFPYPIVRKAFYYKQTQLDTDRTISVKDLYDVYLQVDDYMAQGDSKPEYRVQVLFSDPAMPKLETVLTPSGIHYELACSQLASFITPNFNHYFNSIPPSAYIRLVKDDVPERVELIVLPFDKDLRRTGGGERTGVAVFDAHGNFKQACAGTPPVRALPLTAFREKPLEVNVSDFINYLPEEIENSEDIWFLYPEEEQAAVLNPTVYIGKNFQNFSEHFLAMTPLQKETANPDKLTRKQKLRERWDCISSNFTHQDWQVIRYFYDNMWYLPLGTLDVWKALAANPEGVMAFAVYIALIRDTDEAADAVNRFAEEMGVTVKYLPFPFFSSLCAAIRGFFTENGYSQGDRDILVGRVLDLFGRVSDTPVLRQLTLINMYKNEILPPSLVSEIQEIAAEILKAKEKGDKGKILFPKAGPLVRQIDEARLPGVDRGWLQYLSKKFHERISPFNVANKYTWLMKEEFLEQHAQRIFFFYLSKGFLSYFTQISDGVLSDFPDSLDPRESAMELGYQMAWLEHREKML